MGPGLDISELRSLLPELVLYDEPEDEQIAERIAGAEIVLGNKVLISESLFAGAPDMRFIGLTATGTDNIDLEAARRHGVAVANIRAYCTGSVAEHVFGCLLNLTHSLQGYVADVRGGAWQAASNFCMLTRPINELSAMTLGIVGYGELGKGVARIGEAFGMSVIVSARPGSDTVSEGRVPFEELLTRADAISLHCPLTEDTRHLIDRRELESMKPGAIIINTSRGAVIDNAALAIALKQGNGNMVLHYRKDRERVFSTTGTCPTCGIGFKSLDPTH